MSLLQGATSVKPVTCPSPIKLFRTFRDDLSPSQKEFYMRQRRLHTDTVVLLGETYDGRL